jgi:hypothetical protein
LSDFSGIGINRIDFDADGQIIALSIIDDSPLGDERDVNVMLLGRHLIKGFLFQHLKLEHPPHDENETEEEQNGDQDNANFEPILRFLFHRITIT